MRSATRLTLAASWIFPPIALDCRTGLPERVPLEQAAAAYDRMMSGDARFRMVLTTEQ